MQICHSYQIIDFMKISSTTMGVKKLLYIWKHKSSGLAISIKYHLVWSLMQNVSNEREVSQVTAFLMFTQQIHA